MGRSTSFGEFSRRMAIRAQQVATGTERTIRQAAIAADTAIVTATPVDTGRAKGNWLASVGQTPVVETTEDTDPGGQMTLNQNQRTIEGWRLGQGAIFIANGLPYIQELENGSSQQAPNGMTQSGLDAARAQLKKSSLLR